LIPSELKISSIVKTERNTVGSFRSLSKTRDWLKWWPGGNNDHSPFCTVFTECRFIYNGYKYNISDTLFYNSLLVTASKKDELYEGRINILPVNRDSSLLYWTSTIPTSVNPFIRIETYLESVKQKKNMDSILQHMKVYLDDASNVYGSDIHHEMSGDSILMVMKFQKKSFPSMEEIYDSIQSVKKYISAHQAKENNFPMLLKKKTEDGGIEIMVAIPTNKMLPDQGNIVRQRYVPWKVLVSEVKGGDASINKARAALDSFILDNQIQVMAKAYESMVTNRSIEKDSSKWITRLICAIP
jgi:hypothetical protein